MIRVENLSKFYGGKRALGPVSFEIEDGETVGFLGLNGAGKTTALRILACDLRPSSGTVNVGSVDAVAHPHDVRKRVGFLPENPPLYNDMVVHDYITFAGKLRGMSSAEIKQRMPKVLDLTDLDEVEHEIIGHLSHGYRQRVGVAQAIVHEPEFLILDEPTRGLDPVQIVEMRNLVNDLKENHTVLISSHILTEISHTCDRLLVLGRGEILASGAESDLSANLAEVRHIVVTVLAADDGDPAETLGAIEGVTSVTERGALDGGVSYRIECEADVRPDVARALVEAGHQLLKLDRTHSELEGTFLKLVQGGSGAHH